ncbi:hypothetical protein VFPPC_09369 [Pochonia chlamydosporia 170]|uniref:Uncharacterized protein n=1 Tax=Pochonia chlamydosporia 170 TaxID=1380566 RepID=A0A179F7T7_METCM|nr:hypothetical protein VFPPC_09369 [Pochonia chlamydosporia 170]OAQ61545.1 hypothetical protein VFPPC_09369 [Pochonia chlamydosporia 170]
MGLPLFVEPIESNLPSKVASKTEAASPPPPRRTNRSEIRERRNGIRRAGVRIYSPRERNLPHNTRERLLPWVESPSSRAQDPTGTAADRRSGMFREVLREMSGSDERRRERLEERMSSLFNHSWRDATPNTAPTEHENMSEGVDLGWWPGESPRFSHLRQSRLTPQIRVTGLPEGTRPPPARRSHIPPPQEPVDSRAGDIRPPEPRLIRSLNARQMMPSRRAAQGLDGLGDRERSLSPEVWDTLLSTLTPDPQPPSVGSSFASVTASQTAGPSSGTPTSAPDITEDAPLDAPCESGCENSDMEMDDPDYEHPDFARIRRQRSEAAAAAQQLAATNERFRAQLGAEAGFHAQLFTPTGRTTRQINTPNGPLTIYESTGRLGQPLNASRWRRPLSSTNPYGIWIGQAPVGASGEEDRDPDGPLQHAGETPSSTHANPMASEDDWAGMQRIVRSLARREDIPDEWWADAGLSRTLRQEETSTTGSSTPRQNI